MANPNRLAVARAGAGAAPSPVSLYRPSLLPVAKLLILGISSLPALLASPILSGSSSFSSSSSSRLVDGRPGMAMFEGDEGEGAEGGPSLWMYLAIAVLLVLLGGAFAGLTIALMGQDEIYLEVIKTSGEGAERKHAAQVLRLLKRGKHWVLVTLLLSNVITNETLPIVLDRSLGGGWPAVLGSTVLIVIFGEIIPQSICVRYGLPIGAWMSGPVLILMYIMAPIGWPIAKLLDRLLGEEHGTTYKKAGLKTLVTLHKTLGVAGEQLNEDEVTIISAVLDLKEKPVGAIMTPMGDVFTMSADTVLDEKTMDIILSAGYSRIPIHAPENALNFVGMLLVKILITYDPEDCKRVRDFALATLPETRAETSCLDIVNFFQEGKSHMVLVSEFPGEDTGALGVVTLEDVIEELIGEEIIDESDVFIDVHKAIRRMAPAPRTRVPKGAVVIDPAEDTGDGEERLVDLDEPSPQPRGNGAVLRRLATENQVQKRKVSVGELSSSPKTTFFMRRTSSVAGQSDHEVISRRSDAPDIREHLKHLGPSNLASKPRQTRYTSVKIKPGATVPDGFHVRSAEPPAGPQHSVSYTSLSPAPKGGIGEGLLHSAGKDASDAVLSLQAGYGTIGYPRSPPTISEGVQVDDDNNNSSSVVTPTPREKQQHQDDDNNNIIIDHRSQLSRPTHHSRQHSARSGTSTIGSLHSARGKNHNNNNNKDGSNNNTWAGSGGGAGSTPLRGARSGSITENIVESGGFKKVVLETTSSSSEEGQRKANGSGGGDIIGIGGVGGAGVVGGGVGAGVGADGDGEDGEGEGASADDDRTGGEAGGAANSSQASSKAKKKRRRKRKKGEDAGAGAEEEGGDAERERLI